MVDWVNMMASTLIPGWVARTGRFANGHTFRADTVHPTLGDGAVDWILEVVVVGVVVVDVVVEVVAVVVWSADNAELDDSEAGVA